MPGGGEKLLKSSHFSIDLLDVTPTSGTLGLPNARRIRPGSRTSSVLWERMRRTDTTRMPQIGTALPDQDAIDLIGAWIDAGPAP